MALRLVGVEKRFGTRRALRGVDLELPQGATLVVFGANGAGKTTLLRIIALLGRPSAGTVEVLGLDAKKDPDGIRARVGFLSHEPMLYLDLSAYENLLLAARLHGLSNPQQAAVEMLDRVRLTHRADDPVRGFSRGMTQRMSLARALIHDPDLVLLDEPYTGLDPAAARLADELVVVPRPDGRPRTLVMTSHDPERGWRRGTHFLLLSRGEQVVFGAKCDLDPQAFKDLYDGQVARGLR